MDEYLKMEKFCLETIYSHIGDEESRSIFEKRLCYSLTGDKQRMIWNINKENTVYKKILQFSKTKEVFLFGAGLGSHSAVESNPKIPWRAFIDNDNSKVGKADILPIISFEEFIANSKNAVVFISSSLYGNEMKRQLIDNSFPIEFIIDAKSDSQYFDLSQFKPYENELFIDAGGYDGSTTKYFFQWLQNNGISRGTSIVFEPNSILYNNCKDSLQDYNNVKVVNKGLWHKKDIVKFCNNGIESYVTSNGEEVIETISLDEYLKDEEKPVTFLKMDIEGAELNALKGAERIIKEQKPKLAISIYHKPEDIWEIPNLLLNFVPDYKFFIRHYTFSDADTVLYARLD
jgi:FkbM family methyltransferase